MSNEGNSGIILGAGFDSKSKDSYIIWQHCFDLIYYKNNFDLRWVPTIFLGSHTIKIGVGIPIGIGLCSYTVIDNSYYQEPRVKNESDIFCSIGVRPSVKLTIENVSFEVYYQYLSKAFINCDTIKSNEFGLILKLNIED